MGYLKSPSHPEGADEAIMASPSKNTITRMTDNGR